MNSLTLNSTASRRAISSSWAGPVLPRTAPKEMSTAPAQKSALIKLQSRREEGKWFQSGSRPHRAEGHGVAHRGRAGRGEEGQCWDASPWVAQEDHPPLERREKPL